MRQTVFTCDWCQKPTEETRMLEVWAFPVGTPYRRDLTADVCRLCFDQLLHAIQRIAIRAQDMRELGGRPS